MKNLVHMGIEKLSLVPIEHLSDRPTQARKANWYGWRHRDGDTHKIGDYSPYKIASRLIEKSIGKPFEDTFSYFCTIVPKYQQWVFLEKFEDDRGNGSDYIIDDEGHIQLGSSPYSGWYKRVRRPYKGPYYFKSNDFKTELRHKITGHPKSRFREVYEKVERTYYNRYYKRVVTEIRNGKLLYYEYGTTPSWRTKPIHERYKAQDSDFEAVIIQGWQKAFDSKQDPEYKRLMSEKRKKSKVSFKKKLILDTERAYEIILQTEKKKRELKELNDQKILAHGFDLTTSFRGENQ